MMMRTIKWDGRERTADAILNMLPAGMASYFGGAPGYPRELFISSTLKPRGKKWRVVPRGARVGMRGGKPCINRGNTDDRHR